ncbi:hypothetical protein [Pseudomonas zhanjiangensis]|uniref:Lipoprotein n=1 Tax=Pseudomonas zhanjiangensis TaxID=3239015 RepID=A0ABV3YYF6_9PSED
MTLQALWSLFLAHPAQWVNGLALFFAGAGAWLLLATRVREHRAIAQLAAASRMGEQGCAEDEPTLRLNRFFYRFGYLCLAVALAVSWISTRL